MCVDAKSTIIVTKNAEDYGVHHAPDGNKLLRIPAFAFLYLIGYLEKNNSNSI